MMINKNNFIVRNLNSSKVMNRLASPSAATISVAILITENKIVRMYNSLTDKKEDIKSRRYTACTDGLHELFCLASLVFIVPLFKKGGLMLGKRFFAPDAFKHIDMDKIRALKLPAILKDPKTAKQIAEDNMKDPKRLLAEAAKAAKKLEKEGAFSSFKYELKNAMDKIDKYNGNIENNVRTALFGEKPRQIIIDTKDGLVQVTKAGHDSKSFINDFLGDTKDSDAIKKALDSKFIEKFNGGKEAAEKLQKDGTHLFTPGKEFVGQTKEDDMRIKGSRGFGEAMGLTAAIAVISPLFTTRYVPKFLNLIGYGQDSAKTKKDTNTSKEAPVTSKTINNCDEFLSKNKKAS